MAKKYRFIHLHRLVPNMLTVLALCLGITGVRYAIDSRFEIATALVVIAGFLDSIDGKVARFFDSASDFGAHLDSLSDLINFGVTPGIIIFLWSLDDIPYRGVGWAVILVYVCCGALRLARFNVSNLKEDPKDKVKNSEFEDLICNHKRNFFVGLPTPAAGILVLTPVISTFHFFKEFQFPPMFMAIYTLLIGLAMISSIPVFAGKYIKISPQYVPVVVITIWFIIAMIVIEPWFTIPILMLLYIFAISVGVYYYYRKLRLLTQNKKQ